MVDETLSRMSLVQLSAAIAARKVSSQEVVLNNIEQLEKSASSLNCLARLFPEEALKAAKIADKQLFSGKPKGLLHGVPLLHKDMFYSSGNITACGSKICADYVTDVTATALLKLEQAGALDIGRLNMVEFAYGLTGHNEITGDVRNPWNPEYITGGSSSGPAAAVAAFLSYGSLGSDTGGSIRFPASCCGLVGMKPTYGRVSRFGAMPLSFSLDHLGPLTRTVADCSLLTNIISGRDSKDTTSSTQPVPAFISKAESGIRGLKIGVPTKRSGNSAGFLDPLHPEVQREMENSLAVFRGLGAKVVEIPLPESFEISNAMANIIGGAESSSAHANWLKEQPENYGSQTRERLLTGLLFSATDYLDALKLRKIVLEEFLQDVFEQVDILHCPVVPIPVPTLAESDIKANPGFIEYLSLLGHFTRPFDYLGLPALSVPAGKTDNGLPTGFQLIAPPFEESLLFSTALAYEKENPWSFPE
ncbi:MAG: amidase [SAR324 cluster bacterium]|nr:amidase [SAR324 cluster bacterium]MBL7034813.1 amidase [SAR324 cluster bacterium]